MGAIPANKGIHLDQALLSLRNPGPATVTYPFRPPEPGRSGPPLTVAGNPSSASSGGPGRQILDDRGADGPTPGPSRAKGAKDPIPHTKGTVSPDHSEFSRKYGSKSLPKLVESFFGLKKFGRLRKLLKNTIACSLAKNTWKRYESALKTWKTFAAYRGSDWKRFNRALTTEFVLWCGKKKTLRPGTVKAYLGVLKNMNKLRQELREGGGDHVEKMLFKGLGNTCVGKTKNKKFLSHPSLWMLYQKSKRG